MGIAYFPEIYPDELIYSVLARYHLHSGYLYYKDTEKDLLRSKQGMTTGNQGYSDKKIMLSIIENLHFF